MKKDRLQRSICAVLLCCACITVPVDASGQASTDTVPFSYLEQFPGAIFLNGPIDIRSPLAFKRALQAHPGVRVVVLNSIGGSVQAALLISEEIHEKQLITYIPEGSECVSACSYIFFAGHARMAQGKLGVHQIWGTTDVETAQLNLSDVIEVLSKYDVSPTVITKMLRTPPTDMYVFSAAEIAELNINKPVNTSETLSGQRTENQPRHVSPQSAEETYASLPDVVPIPKGKPSTKPSRAGGIASIVVLNLLTSAQRSIAELERAANKAYAATVLLDDAVVTRGDLVARLKRNALEWPERRIVVDLHNMTQSCEGRICTIKGRYEHFQSDGATKKLHSMVDFMFEVETGYMTIITQREIRNAIR